MALSQSALSELLEAFRTGDGVDMIREAVHTVLQELVEFEAATVIGADRTNAPRTAAPNATASADLGQGRRCGSPIRGAALG